MYDKLDDFEYFADLFVTRFVTGTVFGLMAVQGYVWKDLNFHGLGFIL